MLTTYAMHYPARKKIAVLAKMVLLLNLTGCGGGSSNLNNSVNPSGASTSSKMATVTDQEISAVNAVASGIENDNSKPVLVIDKNEITRWSSAFKDDEWIYLDFGKAVQFSRIKINWENAHATAYDLQTSDDAVNWATVKSLTASQGGIEDLAIAGTGKFLRMKGIKRATPYGYSIFEINVWGHAVDGSASDTSSGAGSVTSPVSGTSSEPSTSTTRTVNVAGTTISYQSLFAADTPVMEQIQYTEADGTLVTRAGYRPTLRHAREKGEYWYNNGDFAVESGINTKDEGPGHYFEWPQLYFQGRTYGLLIRDGTPAGRSSLDIYQVVNSGNWVNPQLPDSGAFIRTGINVFRSTSVGTYGWKYGAGIQNTSDAYKNILVDHDAGAAGQICLPGSALLDCYMSFPLRNNWQTDAPFKLGDFFEVTTSSFLDYYHQNNDQNNPVIFAKIDGLDPRFYAFEQLYVVGKGMVPWYGTEPALNTTPIPDEALSGGMASVSFNYSEEPMRVFQQSVNNIGITNLQRFVEGRRLFHTSFLDGKHSEHPDINPPLTEHMNQLGSRFNGVRCLECHALNGRSQKPEIAKPINTLAVLTAASSSMSARVPDPVYGMNVLQRTLDANAPDYSVTVASFEPVLHKMANGETVELQKPVYAFKGPVPAQYSVRQAPQVIGMGLLEAIDESTILQFAVPHDGVNGVPNWSIDPQTGERHLGRFGWKAGKGSIRHQIAEALMLDMGVTTPVYPTRDCQKDLNSSMCKTSPQTTAGLTEADLQKMVHYIQLIGVPAQRSIRSGFVPGMRVSSEHDVNPVRIANGSRLFAQAGCAACHIPQMKTGNTHPFAEVRNQTIHPYTDLLLHDMGEGLADHLIEGQAQPAMWRTQPLWGIGSLPYVQESPEEIAGPDLAHGPVSNARYLHDGRARTLTEAILWHDGEAKASRLNFELLTASQREDILLFLSSL